MHTCSFEMKFSYDIHFTQDFLGLNNSILADFFNKEGLHEKTKCLVLIDQRLSELYKNLHTDFQTYIESFNLKIELLPFCILPAGELSKNKFSLMSDLYDLILSHEIDRHSYLVSIGGGSTNDVAGLLATTAHRGIKHIRIPTTVLAQNDAAIGVKNGINFKGVKNFIGTFAVPHLIINDSEFLKTLDERDYISGFAEAVKISLIKDPDFFEWIENNVDQLNNRNEKAVNYLIKQTAILHTHHFANSGDPFERGSSRPLDYGHWLAHKLESKSQFELRHGEAVGIGMLLDARYAYEQGLLNEHHFIRIQNLLFKLGLLNQKQWISEINSKDIENSLADFKAHLGGNLSIPLLNKIGDFHNVNKINTVNYLEITRDFQ